jgi:hypothetical protein
LRLPRSIDELDIPSAWPCIVTGATGSRNRITTPTLAWRAMNAISGPLPECGVLLALRTVPSWCRDGARSADEPLPQFADALDGADQFVAVGQPALPRAAEADAGRSTGEDDVTGSSGSTLDSLAMRAGTEKMGCLVRSCCTSSPLMAQVSSRSLGSSNSSGVTSQGPVGAKPRYDLPWLNWGAGPSIWMIRRGWRPRRTSPGPIASAAPSADPADGPGPPAGRPVCPTPCRPAPGRWPDLGFSAVAAFPDPPKAVPCSSPFDHRIPGRPCVRRKLFRTDQVDRAMLRQIRDTQRVERTRTAQLPPEDSGPWTIGRSGHMARHAPPSQRADVAPDKEAMAGRTGTGPREKDS